MLHYHLNESVRQLLYNEIRESRSFPSLSATPLVIKGLCIKWTTSRTLLAESSIFRILTTPTTSLEGNDISKAMLKGLEKRKQTLEVKLHEMQDSITERKDDAVDFKMMGIDHLFVDESHQFKNLMFNTRHDRVSGLGNPDGAQRALNMLFAIRTIQVFPLSYLFQKNQYKCNMVPSLPTGLCGIEPVEHAPV